ncbi:MAG: asparagine synthetase B [Candidatus Bathyarchaeota archaeon]|jgi:asparagine synthase (glutamine-hydrolysing)|nr:asparagine synthetase B [Candidatus Bathyarchaeota archaeon A05DMB-5]MDH7557170.1 asparagine synthetase B [Candidatus Bathyarchaeota archaeon]
MGALIAVLNKRGENAAETVVAMLKVLEHKGVDTFGIASPTEVKIAKSVGALVNRDFDSPIIIGHVFSRILTTDKPQPIKLENATLVFEGRLYAVTAENFAKKLRQNHEKTAEESIKKAEGDFAFVIAEKEKLIAGKDILGVRPLYYGQNANLTCLASERKALWRIGIKNVNSFPPGNMAFINAHGFKFKSVKMLAYSEPRHLTIQAAAKKLQRFLQQSIKKRVLELKEVAVAFSGGLDSSIIAFLAKKIATDVHLIHVSLEEQPETEHAKKAAEELVLPIHVHFFSEKDVEKTLPKVLWLIEEPDPVKTSIGIPIYWAAEKAAKANFKVMLAGQGADELFGGYKRYVDDYSTCGSEMVYRAMFNDITKMYETNFERDFKLCNFHNVELRLPFATYQIAQFAIELPLEMKIKLPDDGMRKLVLRQVARNLGLPRTIVEKPKKAIQYTSGVSKTLKKLAKKEGLSERDYVKKTFFTLFKKMK